MWLSPAQCLKLRETSDTTAPPPNSAVLMDNGFQKGIRQDVYMIDCAEFAGIGMPSLQQKTPFATRVGSLINFTTARELYLNLDENRSDCRASNFIGKILIQTPGNYTFLLKSYGQAVLRLQDTVVINKTNITRTSKAGNFIVESPGGLWLGLDYYNQGPNAKIVLKYIGPDTNFEKKTVPPEAFEHRTHPKDQTTAAPTTASPASGATTAAATATTAGPMPTLTAVASTAASASTGAPGLFVQPTAAPEITIPTIPIAAASKAPAAATNTAQAATAAAATVTAAAATNTALPTTVGATPPPP